MRSEFRARIVLALLATGCAMPVYAQDAPGDEPSDEILVTAQRREQSLLDVPLAVSALAGESLAT
jgi:iron complex outermembrane receptor protein